MEDTETSGIPRWADRIIRASFALLFILVPLILTSVNYELFEYNKMMVTYGLTAIIAGAWLIKMISLREIRIAKTPLDIPLALFFASQLLSSLFSMDPHVSWFGYYSRFNGGMLSIISYILLYYAFVSNYDDYKNYIKISLATGVVVALYGVAERLGVDKQLWVQDVQNRVFSTLGQPNWLAAYLVALAPMAMAFGLQARSSKFTIQSISVGFWIWNIITVLFFLVLLFTRSRSGLAGFAAADIAFWGLLWWKTHNTRMLRMPFLILHAAFALIVFVNGTYVDSIDKWVTFRAWKERIAQSQRISTPPQQDVPAPAVATPSATYTAPLLETGGTESGTIRKYVWQGAIAAWKSSTKTFFIGTGTETFAFAFFQFRPEGHNLTSEWDFLYNKAHNEYLNYLATTGIFGLGSYLVIIGSVIWFFFRQIFRGSLHIDLFTARAALLAGWLSILVTNFFGFSVVIVQLLLFLFPAMMIAGNQQWKTLHIHFPYHVSKWISLALFLVLLGVAVLLIMLSRIWYA
ncbi:O-antigen ligase family protein, partial [Candidatus Gottesmanbacteria bacterium]|nr:O-antigen ligase family protein [Candidatus Gottesmanbacteria bacterium]